MNRKSWMTAIMLCVIVMLFGCGAGLSKGEQCAVNGYKDLKSICPDPSSITIRGDMMHLYVKDDGGAHDYIFSEISYKDSGGDTVSDMIFICDGKVTGCVNDTNLAIMGFTSGFAFAKDAETCFNHYKELKRATETSDDTDNYKREILSGEKIAGLVSVDYKAK